MTETLGNTDPDKGDTGVEPGVSGSSPAASATPGDNATLPDNPGTLSCLPRARVTLLAAPLVRARRAVPPRPTTNRGLRVLIVRRRNGRQARTCDIVGVALPTGRHRTALTTATSTSCTPAARHSRRKRIPASPVKGLPDRSSSSFPAASPTSRSFLVQPLGTNGRINGALQREKSLQAWQATRSGLAFLSGSSGRLLRSSFFARFFLARSSIPRHYTTPPS